MSDIVKLFSEVFEVYVFCAKLGESVREERERGIFGEANANVLPSPCCCFFNCNLTILA